MSVLTDYIDKLIANNAKHRKGFYIRQATIRLAASNAVEELGELLVELELCKDKELSTKAMEELADVWAVVNHLVMLSGFTHKDLDYMAVSKLGERFTV